MSIVQNEVDLRIIELERQLGALKREREQEKINAENPMVVRVVKSEINYARVSRTPFAPRVPRSNGSKWIVCIERLIHTSATRFDGRVLATLFESEEVARLTAEAFARHFKVRFVA